MGRERAKGEGNLFRRGGGMRNQTALGDGFGCASGALQGCWYRCIVLLWFGGASITVT